MNAIAIEENRLKKVKGKSIESLFRTLSKNNHRMLQMVDRKSGILISLNAIIISFIISAKASNLEFGIFSYSPEIILISSSLSLIISLFAIRPFPISSEQILGKSNHLLNIDTISNSNIKDYKKKFNGILKDDNLVYEAMTEDIFYIGKNIDRKHKILKLSAAIFVLGHISSGLMDLFI